MNRDEALQSVRQNIKNENLVRHMMATEAIMRALAVRFNENADEWGWPAYCMISTWKSSATICLCTANAARKWSNSSARAMLSATPSSAITAPTVSLFRH